MEEQMNEDVLVVVSKLKKYVKEATGLSTAGTVPAILTELVKKVCLEAAESAKKDGRKTLMDRDFTNITETACMQSKTTESASCCM